MKAIRPLLLLAIRATFACAAFAQPPASTDSGFDEYRIVAQRNIFDPDRTPFSGNTAYVAPRPRSSGQRAPDFVALTGIMVTNDKSLAFFSGSRSDYNKVVPVNGDIAGAKLLKISPAGIEVQRAGKNINIGVGQTVPLEGTTPGTAPTSFAASSAPAPAGDTSEPSTSLPPNLNDVMRRMMERRQQQLK